MGLPEWVVKHKEKGTEVRHINGRYYLYKISSVWDPGKKRARKITGKFLGRIMPEGVVKPRHERIMEGVTVKEFGATAFLQAHCRDIADVLSKEYPREWKRILAFSMFRLMHNSPIKNLSHHYSASYISETMGNLSLSPKVMGVFLRDIGRDREAMKRFLHHFVQGTKFAVIDTTSVLSLSEGIISATLGHNSKSEYVPQARLLLLYSLDRRMPAYFRLLVGSVADVSSVRLTMEEAGIKDAVLIGDKGFHSEGNIKELEAKDIRYILPLKRNSVLITYEPLAAGDRTMMDGHFFFEKRVIWHYTRMHGSRKSITYLDSRLRAEEEKDFLLRIEDKKEKMPEFFGKQHSLGTITVITDYEGGPEEIFGLLKQRIEIENVFDTFKNTLNADRTYMRDDYQLEGWMFINFVSLLLYYKTYILLMEKKLLRKYSTKDVLLHLSRVFKLKMEKNWVLSEIPKTSRMLIEKLDIGKHIT